MAVTILFLNAGRRVELLRAFRAALDACHPAGRLLTTDINPLAPALYLGDTHFRLPRSRDVGFREAFTTLLRHEHVDLVIPLIDPDLLVLAQRRAELEATGARLLLSPHAAIASCSDKLRTADTLRELGYRMPAILSPDHVGASDFPVFIKPRDGSGSAGAVKVSTPDEFAYHLRTVPNALVQQYIAGEEYTVDVFSDWDARPLVAVPRHRLRTRAGEVLVGRVTRDAAMETLCREIARRLGTVGPINIQLIRAEDGLYVIEINPRFGGGCPLSIAAGAPMPAWAVAMAQQRPLSAEGLTIQDGLTMLRYDEALYLPAAELS